MGESQLCLVPETPPFSEERGLDLLDIGRRSLLGEPSERSTMHSEIRRDAGQTAWPLTDSSRTLADLLQSAQDVQRARSAKEEAERQAARNEELAAIVANPKKTIRRLDQCVAERNGNGYLQAAGHLRDLSDAIGSEVAQEIANDLRKHYPRHRSLLRILNEAGF